MVSPYADILSGFGIQDTDTDDILAPAAPPQPEAAPGASVVSKAPGRAGKGDPLAAYRDIVGGADARAGDPAASATAEPPPTQAETNPFEITQPAYEGLRAKFADLPDFDTFSRDAGVQKRAFDLMTRDNTELLSRDLGRDPTPADLYLAHFFGPGEAIAAATADPGAAIEDVLSEETLRQTPNLTNLKTVGALGERLQQMLGGTGKAAQAAPVGLDPKSTGADDDLLAGPPSPYADILAGFEAREGAAESTSNWLRLLWPSLERGGRRGLIDMNVLEREIGWDSPQEAARDIAAQERLIAEIPPPPETVEVLEKISSEGTGFGEAMGLLASNPGTLATVIGESFGRFAPVLGAAGATAAAAPAGGAMLLGALVTGLGSYGIEHGAAVQDALGEAGIDPTDDAQVAKMLADPEMMAEARESAAKHGIPVAAFDAVSFGIAGKIFGLARNAGRVVRSAALGGELGVQAGFGGAGEAFGQLFEEGRIARPGDVAVEIAAEIPTGAAEVAIGATRGQPREDLIGAGRTPPEGPDGKPVGPGTPEYAAWINERKSKLGIPGTADLAPAQLDVAEDARAIVEEIAPGTETRFFERLVPSEDQRAAMAESGALPGEQEVAGFYLDNVANISLNLERFDPLDTAFHEPFHRLQDSMLTDTQRETLARDFRDGMTFRDFPDFVQSEMGRITLPDGQTFLEAYAGNMEGRRFTAREAQAVAFAAYARARRSEGRVRGLRPGIRGAFERLYQFFQRLGERLGRRGVTTESLFRDIERGRVGRQAPADQQARQTRTQGAAPEEWTPRDTTEPEASEPGQIVSRETPPTQQTAGVAPGGRTSPSVPAGRASPEASPDVVGVPPQAGAVGFADFRAALPLDPGGVPDVPETGYRIMEEVAGTRAWNEMSPDQQRQAIARAREMADAQTSGTPAPETPRPRESEQLDLDIDDTAEAMYSATPRAQRPVRVHGTTDLAAFRADEVGRARVALEAMGEDLEIQADVPIRLTRGQEVDPAEGRSFGLEHIMVPETEGGHLEQIATALKLRPDRLRPEHVGEFVADTLSNADRLILTNAGQLSLVWDRGRASPVRYWVAGVGRYPLVDRRGGGRDEKFYGVTTAFPTSQENLKGTRLIMQRRPGEGTRYTDRLLEGRLPVRDQGPSREAPAGEAAAGRAAPPAESLPEPGPQDRAPRPQGQAPQGQGGRPILRLRRPPGGDPQFSVTPSTPGSSGVTPETNPVWFSPLGRNILETPQAKGSVDQWKGIIRNLTSKGVKRDEIDWSGVIDWLDEQTGTVTKDQIADYLETDHIRVTETLKGQGLTEEQETAVAAKIDELVAELVEDRLQDAYIPRPQTGAMGNDTDGWIATLDWSAGGTPAIDADPLPGVFATESEARVAAEEEAARLNADALEDARGDIRNDIDPATLTMAAREELGLPQDETTKFSRYTLPGGEDYKELLLALPVTPDMSEPNAMQARLDASDMGPYERTAAQDMIDHQRRRIQAQAGFPGPHFDEPNILAHVRFDTRYIDGTKTLFVDEIQSDWHQEGRKRGYKDPSNYQIIQDEGGIWRIRDAQGQRIDLRDRTSGFSTRQGAETALNSLARSGQLPGVPNAPFKTTWPELAFKRMIRYAADNGFDNIGWASTPEQVATIERWPDFREEDGRYFSGDSDVTAIVRRYTETLPRFAKKFTKKWGVAPEKAEAVTRRITVADRIEEIEEMVPGGLDPLPDDLRDELRRLRDRPADTLVEDREEIWSLEVSNEMQMAALRGMPLFSATPRIQGTPEQERVGARIQPTDQNVPFRQMIQNRLDQADRRFKLRFKQGFLDMFATWEHYEKAVFGQVLDASRSAYKAALATTGLIGQMHIVMRYGALTYDRAEGVVAPKKIYDANGEEIGGLESILGPLAKEGKLQLWKWWAIANRSQRLINEGRESLLSQKDIDALLPLGEKYPEFRKALADWEVLNNAMLDMAEDIGAIDPDSRQLWQKDDYVPFYRILEEGDVLAPRNQSGIGKQRSGIRTLTGGEDPVGDLVENMVLNLTHLTDLTNKTIAMQRMVAHTEGTGVLEEISAAKIKGTHVTGEMIERALKKAGIDIRTLSPAEREQYVRLMHFVPHQDPDIVHVLENGKPRYFRVHDPLLLRSMASLSPQQLDGVIKIFRAAKRTVTTMITADPGFMLANAFRDTLAAWVQVPANYIPFVDTFKGMAASFKEEDDFLRIMAAGGVSGGFYRTEAADVSRHLKGEAARLTRRGVRENFRRAWEFWMRVGAASEQANRVAIYRGVRKDGGTTAEAAYQARDLLNFAMRGDHKIMQWLAETVPFLNARVQGIYRLGRAYRDNRKSMIYRGGIITAATLGLMAVNWDDERYWELNPWDRDTNYHFWILGQHFRIPKPFEIGAVFSTMPERILSAASGQDDLSKDTIGAIQRMFMDTFALNPMPQLFMPLIEQYANWHSFLDRPIVGYGMQRLEPEAQFTSQTSETAVLAGQATGASPKRIEHLVNGYFGTLGSYILGAVDAVSARALGRPWGPSWRVDQLPVLKRFIREDPAFSTRYLTDLYELKNDVDQVYSTISRYRKEGDFEKVKSLVEANRDKLGLRGPLNRLVNAIQMNRNRMTQVELSETMSSQEKRDALDRLLEQRNRISRQVETLSKRI